MEVKVTPIEQAQILEFNIRIPKGANTYSSPISTLTVNPRWTKTIDNMQITKLDVIHNLQYTDCEGKVKVLTNRTSTILHSETDATPVTHNVLDVIIPEGVTIVDQHIADNSPTPVPMKGHCAYSVFLIGMTSPVTPS